MINIEQILESGISQSTWPDGFNIDQYGASGPAFTPENFQFLCTVIDELAAFVKAVNDKLKEVT